MIAGKYTVCILFEALILSNLKPKQLHFKYFKNVGMVIEYVMLKNSVLLL